MAKIYFYKYKDLIENGEETFSDVLNFRMEEVPELWRNEVIDLLIKEFGN